MHACMCISVCLMLHCCQVCRAQLHWKRYREIARRKVSIICANLAVCLCVTVFGTSEKKRATQQREQLHASNGKVVQQSQQQVVESFPSPPQALQAIQSPLFCSDSPITVVVAFTRTLRQVNERTEIRSRLVEKEGYTQREREKTKDDVARRTTDCRWRHWR